MIQAWAFIFLWNKYIIFFIILFVAHGFIFFSFMYMHVCSAKSNIILKINTKIAISIYHIINCLSMTLVISSIHMNTWQLVMGCNSSWCANFIGGMYHGSREIVCNEIHAIAYKYVMNRQHCNKGEQIMYIYMCMFLHIFQTPRLFCYHWHYYQNSNIRCTKSQN